MEYVNPTSRLQQAPYPVIGFAEHVRSRLEALYSPIQPPPYALSEEKVQLEALSAHVKKDPYRFFEDYNASVNQKLAGLKAGMITRLSDPLLYDCMEDCCAALGFGSLAGYTYEPEQEGMVYNAFATGYMDMSWVMLSSAYRRQNLLSDLELTFLLGHELGHVAGMHSSVASVLKQKPESARAHEYTADRGGLLAVLWRLARREPDLPPEEMYQKALEASTGLLHKQYILHRFAASEPWDRQTLEAKLTDPACAVPEKPAGRKDNHPSASERIRALTEYIRLTEFAKCIHTMWGSGHAAVLRFGEEAEHV